MKKKYDADQFLDNVFKIVDMGEKSFEFPSRFYKDYFQGERTLYQSSQTEAKKFDMLWIKTIESYFQSINRITINLKSTLKFQGEILPIEKTKKVGRESVIHLMSHSNLIREVKDEEITPKQIFTTLSEIDYGIYENRFIMTLIIRLRDFIGKRLKVMRESIKGTHTTRLNVSSRFNMGGSDVEMLVDLRRIQPSNSKATEEHNEQVLEKAERLHKLVSRLTASQFMQIMKKYKPVNSPIMQTQIILKNPDFRNAYLLWLFLDKCNDLGYDLTIDTVKNRFSNEYIKDINRSMLLLFTSVVANDKLATDDSLEGKVTYREVKAQALQSLPDEIDVFTPYTIGIEDTSLNEYYLSRNKQLLKKQLEDYESETGSNKKVALKKVLNDTLKITEAVYESYFEINADDDIYTRLVKEDDPNVMLETAYEKYTVSKTIREVKEEDYLKAVNLERKWQEQLKQKQTEVINQLKAESAHTLEEALAKDRKEYSKQFESTGALIAQEKTKLARDIKNELNEYEKKLSAELRKEKTRIAAETKIKIVEEKKKLKLQAERLRLQELEKAKKEKEQMKQKAKAQKEQLAQSMNKQKSEFIKKEKEKIAAIKKGE